jgi:hypothetical protein
VLVAMAGSSNSTDGGRRSAVNPADGVTSVCAVGIAQVSTYVAYALTCDSTLFRSTMQAPPGRRSMCSRVLPAEPTISDRKHRLGELWLALPTASIERRWGVTLGAWHARPVRQGRAGDVDALDAQRLWAGAARTHGLDRRRRDGNSHPWTVAT